VSKVKRKRIAVVDASPLIYLAKADYLKRLARVYDVHVARAVFEEATVKEYLRDARRIIKAATNGLIKVLEVKDTERVKELITRRFAPFATGEAETVTLFFEVNADCVLFTNHKAAGRASREGVRTISLDDLAREAYRMGIFSRNDVLRYIRDLRNGAGYYPARMRLLEKEFKSLKPLRIGGGYELHQGCRGKG